VVREWGVWHRKTNPRQQIADYFSNLRFLEARPPYIVTRRGIKANVLRASAFDKRNSRLPWIERICDQTFRNFGCTPAKLCNGIPSGFKNNSTGNLIVKFHN